MGKGEVKSVGEERGLLKKIGEMLDRVEIFFVEQIFRVNYTLLKLVKHF